MKIKKIIVPLCMFLGAGIVTGCTKDNAEQSIEQTIEENENTTTDTVKVKEDLVIDDVKTGLIESGLLAQKTFDSSPKDSYIFESVKDVIEDGFVSQAMINVKLQDVFFIKTTDVDAVEKAILDYKTEGLRSFGDGYGGEDNIKAVAESKLVKMDGYVYFIATCNADEVEEKLLELIK